MNVETIKTFVTGERDANQRLTVGSVSLSFVLTIYLGGQSPQLRY